MDEPVNHNKQYSGAIIEQYLQGKMSAAEMHELEKAALEDAFLAEALEGYTNTPVNIEADLAALQQQLAAKQHTDSKIIPIARRNWWRMGIAAALLVGVAAMAYQFLLKPNTSEPNTLAKKEEKSAPASDSNTIITLAKPDSITNGNKPAAGNTTVQNTQPATALQNDSAGKDITMPGGVNDETVAAEKTTTTIPAAPASKKDDAKSGTEPAKAAESADVVVTAPDKYKAVTSNERKAANSNAAHQNQANYYFKGRITDRSNNPLPYARINIKPNNIGTYADARGNFTLISSDTAIQIEVKANGYEASLANLDHNRSLNGIKLNEEKRSLNRAEVVGNATNYNLKKRSGVIKGEVVEPEEGWESYDAYLVNNMELPQEVRKKRISGEVEVSVEVDQQGNVTNVMVDKSLCQQCDAEAVRLVKEGPKWKATRGVKGKAKVVVNFNQ
jgi:TonB family protein